MKNPTSVLPTLQETADSYVIQKLEDKWKRENPGRIQVFFDTYEVVRMCQGIWAFEKLLQMNMKLFHEEATLVHSLAFEGWLGHIHLLPPHQDELVFKLCNKSNIFPSSGIHLDKLGDELLANLGIPPLGLRPDASMKDLKTYVSNLKTNARDFFKANNMLRYPTWYRRYRHLFEEKKIIRLDDSSYDLDKVTDGPYFKKIKEALNARRKNYHKSNFIDAIAFSILQERLNNFKIDPENKPLPVFFVSRQGTWAALEDLVQETKNEKDAYFSYQREGQTIPIIRNAEYLILDCIFNSKETDDPLGDFLKGLKISIEDEHKRESLKWPGNSPHLQQFHSDVYDQIEDQFFRRVWLENGIEGFDKAILEFIDFKESTARQIKAVTIRQREAIKKNLRRDTNRFALIDNILTELLTLDKIIEREEFISDGTINVFSDLGMTRFSFTEECSSQIQTIVNQFLNSSSKGVTDDNFSKQAAQLVTLLADGAFRRKHMDLAVGLAVLWVFGKYKLIATVANLCNKDYDNFHIPQLYASALLLGEDKNPLRALEICDCMASKFLTIDRDNYQVRIGIAYIHWLAWNETYNYPCIPELMNSADTGSFREKPNFEWMRTAIEHIRQVLSFLTREKRFEEQSKILWRNRRYFYSINLYVFFITQSATPEDFENEEIVQWVRELANGRHQADYWQSRFHDTIARYYLRKAVLAKAPEQFNKNLELAAWSNRQSVKEAKKKEVFVEQLHMDIETLRTEGFKKNHTDKGVLEFT